MNTIEETHIGQRVRREKLRDGRSHHIDSVTAGSVTTACGRFMQRRQYETGGLVLLPAGEPGCAVCARITLRRLREATAPK